MTGRSLKEITDGMRLQTRAAMRLAAAGVFGLAVIAGTAVVSGSGTAKADSIYIGSGGIGFSFGTGGYRGGAYYGGRGYYGGGYYRPHRPYYRPYYKRPYRYRSRVRINPPLYIAPPVVVHPGAPQRVPYTKTGLAPFTPEYYAYCARKFKSFNPNTGTYLAYSGKYRFCR